MTAATNEPSRTRLVRGTGVAYLAYVLIASWQVLAHLDDDQGRLQALLAAPFLLVFAAVAIGLVRGSRLAIGAGTWLFGFFAVLSALVVLAGLEASDTAQEILQASRLGLLIYSPLWILLWVGARRPAGAAARAPSAVLLPLALRCFAWLFWLPALAAVVTTVLASIQRRALLPLGLGGLSALVLAILALRYGRALATPRPLAVAVATLCSGIVSLVAGTAMVSCAKHEVAWACVLALPCVFGTWIAYSSISFAVRLASRRRR